jgi:hypothetical protein
MDGKPSSCRSAAKGAQDEPERIDARTLLAEMQARRMSRNAIIDELMEVGLTLDEATDAFDDDVPVRLLRSGGQIRRLDPVPIPEPPIGIGGWLLIPAFNLVVLIVVVIGALVEMSQLLGSLDGATPVPSELQTELVVTLALAGGLLGFALVTAWCFFRRHRWAPRLYIALILVLVGLNVLAVVAPGADPGAGTPASLLSLALWAVVWIAYFLRSERVRNTFTG